MFSYIFVLTIANETVQDTYILLSLSATAIVVTGYMDIKSIYYDRMFVRV